MRIMRKISKPGTEPEAVQPQLLALRPRGLAIPAAAAYLGTTPIRIERAIRNGELPARRFGRGYTVLVSDLDAFLDAQPIANPAAFAAPRDDRRRWRKGQKERAA